MRQICENRWSTFGEVTASVYRDVARILSLGGLKPMASAEREPITGVWGQSPHRGPGAEPLAPLKLKGF